jgi:hypothetical protein
MAIASSWILPAGSSQAAWDIRYRNTWCSQSRRKVAQAGSGLSVGRNCRQWAVVQSRDLHALVVNSLKSSQVLQNLTRVISTHNCLALYSGELTALPTHAAHTAIPQNAITPADKHLTMGESAAQEASLSVELRLSFRFESCLCPPPTSTMPVGSARLQASLSLGSLHLSFSPCALGLLIKRVGLLNARHARVTHSASFQVE